MGSSSASERYRVGYAMEAKKVKTFILPSLVEQALAKGLDLVPVDPARPLSEQGPFHCIVHKLYGPAWARELLRFTGPVVDPPDRIEALHSRVTMLEAVSRVRIPFDIAVPEQLLFDPSSSAAPGLQFPAVAKPLLADGGTGSHDMMLILNPNGLRTRRFSSRSSSTTAAYSSRSTSSGATSASSHGPLFLTSARPAVPFSQISNAASSLSSSSCGLPDGLAEQLAGDLRAELGLQLFNFDLIGDGDGDKYYVIDINYFPDLSTTTEMSS